MGKGITMISDIDKYKQSILDMRTTLGEDSTSLFMDKLASSLD